MELVRRLLATQPNITALNLEFSEIDSLDTLLPLLARFPRLQQLDLSGNRLTSLPASLAPLKEIQYLNLANNLFEDCQSLIPALQTLPKLVALALTVNGERDEQLLLSALPKLQVLNDLQVAQGSLQEPGKSRLQQEDLEQVAQLYDEVRSSWKLEDAEKDAELGDDFDQHVKEVMSALYEGVQRSPALEHALMVQAKYDLYEICFQKAVDLVHLRDAAVGGILLKVKQAHAQMVAALVEVVASSLPSMQEQLQQASADTQKAQRETAEVLEAAEQLESEHLTLKEDAHLRAAWKKAELTSELEELRQENQRGSLDQALESHSSQCFGEGARVPAACQCSASHLCSHTCRRQSAFPQAAQRRHRGNLRVQGEVRPEVQGRTTAQGNDGAAHVLLPQQEVRTEGKC